MILRKPYAFLIKHFKKIHLLLLLPLFYLSLKFSSLHHYFDSYVVSGWLLSNDFVIGDYINFVMFVSVFVTFGVTLTVYWLLNYKNKPRFVYLIALIIYFIGLIYLFIARATLSAVLKEMVDIRTIRGLRDFALIFMGLNYVFLAVCFVRGIGFNLKKFDFAKDNEEFEISDADNEEIEVNINIDKSLIMRKYNQRKRFLKYFVVENKKIINIGLIIFGVLVVGITSFNFLILNPVYNENKVIELNYFDFIVEESFVTKEDYKGEVITPEDYSYVIVKFSLENTDKYKNSHNLSLERFNLNTRESLITISKSKGDNFSDLGNIYDGEVLNYGEKNDYLLVFLVPDVEIEDSGKLINRKMLLEYIVKISVDGDGLSLRHKKIRLTPSEFEEVNERDFGLKEEMNFENTLLEKGKLKISGFEIADTFIYSYQECIGGVCENNQKNIITNLFSEVEKTVLKLDIVASDLKDSLYGFFNSYAILKYEMSGSIKSSSIIDLTPSGFEKTLYVDVPSELEDASKIWFEFDIRSIKYNYFLINND